MKVVFLGTGAFAVPSLEATHAAGHEISLVVSQPDRPQGRGLGLRETPVKAAALRLGLPVFQPERLRLEPERVIEERADVLVVVAYGQILRENVLNAARLGAVNVHASLLPKYRGAAPIQWAIANGESVTGVTTMRLDAGMDTGPILLQEECPIGASDTTASLEPRLASMGAILLTRTLAGLGAGTITPAPQDHALATMARLIRKSDGVVDFSQPARRIVDRLRGFTPWPGAHTTFRGRAVRILEAHVGEPGGGDAAGVVRGVSRSGIDVAAGDGSTLRLIRVQPESRGPMAAFDFANGAQLRVGDRFQAENSDETALGGAPPRE